MKKTVILILALVMALSATMAVHAESYPEELPVDGQSVMYSLVARPYFSGAFGTCSCGGTVLLICTGEGAGSETRSCTNAGHGTSCNITVTKCYASGVCSKCDSVNKVVHSETAYHDATGERFTLCWYK